MPAASSPTSSPNKHHPSVTASSSVCVNDGWVYRPPPGLPTTPAETIYLATQRQDIVTQLDLRDTLRMMSRGQSFVQLIRHHHSGNVERKSISLWYDQYEMRADGTACGTGAGALYWSASHHNTASAAPSTRLLTYHKSLPLRSIREIFLGKETAVMRAVSNADPKLCVSLMGESAVLDIIARDTQSLCNWLLGICCVMGANGKKVSEQIAADEDDDEEPAVTVHEEEVSEEAYRRGTRKFSIVSSYKHNRNGAAAIREDDDDDSGRRDSNSSNDGRPQLRIHDDHSSALRLNKPFNQVKTSFIRLRTDVTTQLDEMNSFMTNSIRSLADTATQKLAHLNRELTNESTKRKQLQNKLIEIQGNIRVYVRVRPINHDEVSAGESQCIDIHNDQCSLTVNGSTNGNKTYEFDRVYTDATKQAQVFHDVSPFIQSCIDGYHVCVFAYGQTGSGKSFTMEGPAHDRGVNYRALSELFDITRRNISNGQWTYDIDVSVMEVYNESIRDLLAKGHERDKKLEVRQSESAGVYVDGLNERRVTSVEQVITLLQSEAYPERHTSSTNMNEHSSRSHCVLTVRVKGTNPHSDAITSGKLILIDLAGSERISKSGVSGVGLKEAQCINQSLSALGNVISALQSKSSHIPYRNSKLTYLLSDSLGGNNKCLMFCCLSPAASSMSESLCSLQFASRARAVELGTAKKNISVNENELKKVKTINKTLKEENERLKNESVKFTKNNQSKEKDVAATIQALQATLKEKERMIETLQQQQSQPALVPARGHTMKQASINNGKTTYTYDYDNADGDEENSHPTVVKVDPNAIGQTLTTANAQPFQHNSSPLANSSAFNKKRKDSPNNDDGAAKNKKKSSDEGIKSPTAATQQPPPPVAPSAFSSALLALSRPVLRIGRNRNLIAPQQQQPQSVQTMPSPQPVSSLAAALSRPLNVKLAGGFKASELGSSSALSVLMAARARRAQQSPTHTPTAAPLQTTPIVSPPASTAADDDTIVSGTTVTPTHYGYGMIGHHSDANLTMVEQAKRRIADRVDRRNKAAIHQSKAKLVIQPQLLTAVTTNNTAAVGKWQY